jgi:hypothetical protein
MTTRRWISVVVVVGVLLAAVGVLRHHLILRGRRDYHERMERVLTDRARHIGQTAIAFANREPEIVAQWRAYAT